MRILIIDPACNKPYDPAVLAGEGLGGTEATVVRIVEALKGLGHSVTVAQHNRSSSVSGYVPKLGVLSQKWDTVIVLRDASLLPHVRAKQPRADLFLWCHDLPSLELNSHSDMVRHTRTRVIGVSLWHRDRLMICLPGSEVSYAYNPIEVSCSGGAVVPKKLCFTSSPHKGLELALEVFSALHRKDSDWRLHVFNPGYFSLDANDTPGVLWRGSKPSREVVCEVSTSVAVLHPNTVFPETMGIVTAEANAVGTPVLCHALGATPEIVNGDWQMVDCGRIQSVIDTIVLWGHTMPRTTGKPEFTLSEVLKSWTKILGL